MSKNKIINSLSMLLMLMIAFSCKKNLEGNAPSTAPEFPTSDPLLKYAWHLKNTGQPVFATTPAVAGNDLNLFNTWGEQNFGKSIWIQISDDGVENTHEDLVGNFSTLSDSRNYTLASPYTATSSAPIDTGDNHGTSVAGLAAAVGNSLGSRGVASSAKITSANLLSGAVSITTSHYYNQATGDFDISNMSWGVPQNDLSPIDSTYKALLLSQVNSKRSNKGTIYVKSAGNDYAVLCKGSTTVYCVGNSNFDGDNTLPYIVVVGALNATGQPSSYSSPGSNIWISAFGGEFGAAAPAMTTTDRSGCILGYSATNKTGNFEKGLDSENASCNYTNNFNGTSSAAPVASGSIALILEANPNLTWRELKYILAKTATANNFETGTKTHPYSAMPTGYVWEQKWITNAAGFNFNNSYGFGKINVDSAVSLAKTAATTPIGLGSFTETNYVHAQPTLALPIPDNSASGVTTTINVSSSLKVESVQIKVSATHADISELALELTSPSGTKSILVNGRNSLVGVSNFTSDVFSTNAFYQENTNGNWTLKVVDTKAGTTGSLTEFRLNFFGAP